jgi:hypothetical protein
MLLDRTEVVESGFDRIPASRRAKAFEMKRYLAA